MDKRVAAVQARADAADTRHASERSVQQLASLTPLRGIAALWVVIFHFCWRLPTIHPEHYTGIVFKGYLAVDMFFVLSGFVITHVYKENFAQGVSGSRYRDFLKARIARLYPLHVAVLLLLVVTAMTGRVLDYALTGSIEPIPFIGERSVVGIFANLLMLQGLWSPEFSWNVPSWSISLEFLAYLLFPLLFPVVRRRGRVGKAAIVGLLLAIFGWLAYCTADYFNQSSGAYAILRCLTEFLAGSLLYGFYQSGYGAAMLATNGALLGVGAVLGALLQFDAPDVGIIGLFPILILTAVYNGGYCARLLNAAPLLWLGNISYSLYLLHWFVLFVVADLASPLLGINLTKLPAGRSLSLMAAMVGSSLLLAAYSFRFVEVPGRRWVRERLDIGRVFAKSHRKLGSVLMPVLALFHPSETAGASSSRRRSEEAISTR
ncbi:MAG: acyltransferase [Alphaproteobacteria bacterium]|nr:acyltransferase [Alphaproteobacteria bacterium]